MTNEEKALSLAVCNYLMSLKEIEDDVWYTYKTTFRVIKDNFFPLNSDFKTGIANAYDFISGLRLLLLKINSNHFDSVNDIKNYINNRLSENKCLNLGD